MGKLLDEALNFAVEAHRGQTRKGTKVPYIVHPLEAVCIAATLSGDEEVLAAAALHDVAEDTAFGLEDIRARFGDRVAALVGAETENKREDQPASDTWRIRKEETLNHLLTASREVKILTLCDKLSNIRAMYRDQLALGDALWQRFNLKDKSQHAWYYRTIGQRLRELEGTPAYAEYTELLEKVFG